MEGLSLRAKRRKKRYKSEARVPLVQPIRANQYWAMDFVSDQMVCGVRFRGLTVIDVFTRESLVIEIGSLCPQFEWLMF